MLLPTGRMMLKTAPDGIVVSLCNFLEEDCSLCVTMYVVVVDSHSISLLCGGFVGQSLVHDRWRSAAFFLS